MPEAKVHTVRFEPVGIEMQVAEGETVLRCGVSPGHLGYAWLQGRSVLELQVVVIDGDIELQKYSTFALSDYERKPATFCCAASHAYSDITVELLNYDEDLLRRSIAVKEYEAVGTKSRSSRMTSRCSQSNSIVAQVLGWAVCRSHHSGRA